MNAGRAGTTSRVHAAINRVSLDGMCSRFVCFGFFVVASVWSTQADALRAKAGPAGRNGSGCLNHVVGTRNRAWRGFNRSAFFGTRPTQLDQRRHGENQAENPADRARVPKIARQEAGLIEVHHDRESAVVWSRAVVEEDPR